MCGRTNSNHYRYHHHYCDSDWVATTLGFGASQINGGLSYVFGIPNNSLVQVIIIIIATILFLFLPYQV
ncbi:MAG: BCCT family transporter [Streptococcus salivarius]